jgi:hypothetical protein
MDVYTTSVPATDVLATTVSPQMTSRIPESTSDNVTE